MKILALDVGLKRIGLAISPDAKTAIPVEAILRKGRKQAASDVSKYINEFHPDILVVGIPMGGSCEDEMRRRINHFISLLEIKDDVEIVFQDESGSSYEAKEMMKGAVKQKRDGRIDSIAASVILQRWLEKQNSIKTI